MAKKMMISKTKLRIYETCVRPILTYITETRDETSTRKRLMRTTEMKLLRTIKSVTLKPSRIRSQDIREELEIQYVVRWARKDAR